MTYTENKFIELENFEDIRLKQHEKKNIFCNEYYENNFIKYNGKIYYAKFKNDYAIFNELLGEKISEYFKLQTIKSKLIKLEIKRKHILYGTMSLNFVQENENYSHLDKDLFPFIKIKNDVGLDNLNKLRIFKGKNMIHIMDKKCYIELLCDFKKLIVRDYISRQCDRNSKNIMLKYNGNKVELMPVYDYENSFFLNFYSEYCNIFNFDYRNKLVKDFVRNDNYFQELMYRAMDIDIFSLIEMIEDEYGVHLKDEEKIDYSNFISLRKSMIRGFNLIR